MSNDNFNLDDKVDTKEEAEYRLDVDKWKHRRNFAYKSFYAVLAITLIVLVMAITGYGISSFGAIENYLITTVVGLISVIGMYFGVTGWYDAVKKDKSND